MKLASFFTYRGAGRVSIARYPPRGMAPGFRTYRALAPGPWFNSVTRAQYEELYAAQLALLSAQTVWDDLHALVVPAEPVLLCWERPPFSATNWCHRHLVAEWFRAELNETVTEI